MARPESAARDEPVWGVRGMACTSCCPMADFGLGKWIVQRKALPAGLSVAQTGWKRRRASRAPLPSNQMEHSGGFSTPQTYAKSALTRTGRRSPEALIGSRRSNKMGRSGSPLMLLILLPLLFVSEPTPIGWMSLRCLNDARCSSSAMGANGDGNVIRSALMDKGS